jgi:hypothetical protein
MVGFFTIENTSLDNRSSLYLIVRALDLSLSYATSPTVSIGLAHPRSNAETGHEIGKERVPEESRRDAFWGAKPISEDTLVGGNNLGCPLAELREHLRNPGWEALRAVEPLQIEDFLLFGNNIGPVRCSTNSDWRPDTYSPSRKMQPGLFDTQQV